MHSQHTNIVAAPMNTSTSACSTELRQHLVRPFDSHLFLPPPPAESPASMSTMSPVGRKMITRETVSSVRSVRWGPTCTHQSNTNSEDVRTLWYNAQDLESFQLEKRKVIKALKHVKGDLRVLEGTRYVTRGLECYQTIEFNRTLRRQRKAVVESVLQIQREQILQTGTVTDEEAIAHAARYGSMWAREYAHRIALKDEHDVLQLGEKESCGAEDDAESVRTSDPTSLTTGDTIEPSPMHVEDDAPVAIDSSTVMVAEE